MSKTSEGPEIEYDCAGWTAEQKQELIERLRACGVQVGVDREPARLLVDEPVVAWWSSDILIVAEMGEATIDHIFWTMEEYPNSTELLDSGVYLGPLFEDDRPLAMSFVQSVRHCISKSFKARGRASRSEYWKFVLVWFLLVGIFGGVLQPVVLDALRDTGLPSEFSLVLLLPQAVLLPALVTVTVRRFHDAGFSGLWWFLPIGSLIILALSSERNANKFGPPLRARTESTDVTSA